MKEFIINKFIKIKLEDSQSVIYVAEKRFRQCKFLMINISIENVSLIEEIESVDEAADKLDGTMEWFKDIRNKIDPETSFWAHCSNLQAWVEYNYDSRLIHRNLAFPLLKTLVDNGDQKAKKVFREEIAKRLESGYSGVVNYLINEKYINYLNREEMLFSLLKSEDAEAIMELDAMFQEQLQWNLEPATSYPDCRPYSFLVENRRVSALKMPGMDEFLFNTFPEVITRFTALKKLSLNQNFINEEGIPKSIKNLKSLEELNLFGTSLTNFPSQICEITSLKEINFGFNRIQSIPEEIRNLQKLELLDLNSNLIKELPKSIGELSSLKKIILINNNKLDSLPESIRDLVALKFINIDDALRQKISRPLLNYLIKKNLIAKKQ